jgi:LytS/YehU family sensor histidine kinase
MVNYALITRSKIEKERGKANMAQYRYMKLKHQVNPHFLFNSLNILDCLVCEEKTDDASMYIHKLAGIYRYMIKSEDEEVVPLRDELGFVHQYIDLLSIRFPVGLEVKIDVSEECMSRYVLPCAVQLLIENATKHNAVSKDNPLTVRLFIDGDRIVVTNNIVPKVGRVESTGLGLKYLRQQYLDVSGEVISVTHTDKIFSVTLPLI